MAPSTMQENVRVEDLVETITARHVTEAKNRGGGD
jgi:hypothetical protein